MFKLRDYQKECVRRVVKSYKEDPHGEELLVLPTGSGKTVIFCHAIQQLAVPTLIIAHRDELLEQAAEKYRAIQPDAVIGKVGSGVHEYSSEVTVASVATISRPTHLNMLKTFNYQLIIIDEAHHAASESYQRVLEALPDAFVLMVTATADRLDGKPIIEKEPLYSCSIVDMVTQLHLCDIKAFAIRTDVNLDGVHTRLGDYNEKELDAAVNTPARNRRVVEAYQEHADGRTAICFGVTVKHAQSLAAAFNGYGIPAGVVSGDTPIADRKVLYASLRSGALQVLCNVMVLTEGFDEPKVDCIIMARPTKSRSLYTQCVGRGLRLYPDKTHCTIIDLTDNCKKHSLVGPQTIEKMLGMPLNGTLLETIERSKTKSERKLKERRQKDVELNLLLKPIVLLNQPRVWEVVRDGILQMSVGSVTIRIRQLYDSLLYYVVERDDYHGIPRRVLADKVTMEQAQQVAEARLKTVASEMHNKYGMRPATEKQIAFMRWNAIDYPVNCTKAVASDLIATYVRKHAAA